MRKVMALIGLTREIGASESRLADFTQIPPHSSRIENDCAPRTVCVGRGVDAIASDESACRVGYSGCNAYRDETPPANRSFPDGCPPHRDSLGDRIARSMHWFSQLLDNLHPLANEYGIYVAVFLMLILLLSGFGLPVPEDIPLLGTGMLCFYGIAPLWVMLPITFIFVLGADCIVYGLGRKYGTHVQDLPLLRRFLTKERLDRAGEAYHRHGGKTLFIARFLPGLRAALFFSAGMVKIPFWKMVVYDGFAAIISVPVWVIAGYYGADQIERVKHGVQRGQMVVLAVILLGIATFLLIKVLRKAQASPVNGG